jgi:3-mercaptopyruvate sulfurtransferase SseA
MRSLVLAAATLMVAVAVILAVSAAHQREGATAAASQSSQQAKPSPQAQTQPTPADGVRRVTVEELRAGLENGTAIVIDVRSEEAYKGAHIKGAIWIASNLIADRIKDLPKDKLVVTYCS